MITEQQKIDKIKSMLVDSVEMTIYENGTVMLEHFTSFPMPTCDGGTYWEKETDSVQNYESIDELLAELIYDEAYELTALQDSPNSNEFEQLVEKNYENLCMLWNCQPQ